MRHLKLALSLLSVSLGIGGQAVAATLCVNPGGTGGCLSSIQNAVDAAAKKDEIDIAAGSYVEAVTVGAKKGEITLRGVGVGATTLSNLSSQGAVLTVLGPGTFVHLS